MIVARTLRWLLPVVLTLSGGMCESPTICFGRSWDDLSVKIKLIKG